MAKQDREGKEAGDCSSCVGVMLELAPGNFQWAHGLKRGCYILYSILARRRAWLKSHERINLLLKHLDSVDEDMTPFEKEDDVLESNKENFDA
ncbi:hypothetical protein HN51_064536 [Arachis hypogaea]